MLIYSLTAFFFFFFAAFEITIDHPHTHVVKCTQLVRGKPQVVSFEGIFLSLCLILIWHEFKIVMFNHTNHYLSKNWEWEGKGFGVFSKIFEISWAFSHCSLFTLNILQSTAQRESYMLQTSYRAMHICYLFVYSLYIPHTCEMKCKQGSEKNNSTFNTRHLNILP